MGLGGQTGSDRQGARSSGAHIARSSRLPTSPSGPPASGAQRACAGLEGPPLRERAVSGARGRGSAGALRRRRLRALQDEAVWAGERARRQRRLRAEGTRGPRAAGADGCGDTLGSRPEARELGLSTARFRGRRRVPRPEWPPPQEIRRDTGLSRGAADVRTARTRRAGPGGD